MTSKKSVGLLPRQLCQQKSRFVMNVRTGMWQKCYRTHTGQTVSAMNGATVLRLSKRRRFSNIDNLKMAYLASLMNKSEEPSVDKPMVQQPLASIPEDVPLDMDVNAVN